MKGYVKFASDEFTCCDSSWWIEESSAGKVVIFIDRHSTFHLLRTQKIEDVDFYGNYPKEFFQYA